jgi:hypothetical protein
MEPGLWQQREGGEPFRLDHVTVDIQDDRFSLHLSEPRPPGAKKVRRPAKKIHLPQDRHGNVNLGALMLRDADSIATAGIAVTNARGTLAPGGPIGEKELEESVRGMHPAHIFVGHWPATRHLELNFILAKGPPASGRLPGLLHAAREAKESGSREGIYPVSLVGLQLGSRWLHIGAGFAQGRLMHPAGWLVGEPRPSWATGLPSEGVDAALSIW